MLADLKAYALLAAYAGALMAYILVAIAVVMRFRNGQGLAISAQDGSYLIAASALLIWAVR